MGPQSRRRPRRRRPLRRRRRARRAAPALRAASGTRSCSTSATSLRPSRSTGCSTRATSRPRRSPTSAASTSRRPRSSSATAASSTATPRCTREFGKMGKSLKNAVVARRHLRPTTAPTRCGSTRCSRARSTRAARGTPPPSSACTGCCSGSGATWSTRTPARSRVVDEPLDDDTRRVLHRTIAAVRDGMEELRFNTSIAKITELNNHLTAAYADRGTPPRGRPSRWC